MNLNATSKKQNKQQVENTLTEANCHDDLLSFFKYFGCDQLKALFISEINKMDDLIDINRIFLTTQSIDVILPTDVLKKVISYLSFYQLYELRLISKEFNKIISAIKYIDAYLANNTLFNQILNGKKNENIDEDDYYYLENKNSVGIWLHNKYQNLPIRFKDFYGDDELINALCIKFNVKLEFIGLVLDKTNWEMNDKYMYLSKLKNNDVHIEIYQGFISEKNYDLMADEDDQSFYDEMWKNKTSDSIIEGTFSLICEDVGYHELSGSRPVAVLCVFKFDAISQLINYTS